MVAPIAAALTRIGSALLNRGVGASLARVGANRAAQVAGGRAAGQALAKAAGESAVSRLPIAQQIEGLTVKQRATRLGGNLASVADTLSALRGTKGRDEIGLKERVEVSESSEEQNRQQRVREEEANQAKQAAKSRTWKLATTGGLLAFAFGPGMKKFGEALERLTSTMLERQRELARFSPMIATTFARMEWQQRSLTLGRAVATGPSTARIGDALMELRKELQPLKITAGSISNMMGTGIAHVGTALAIITRWIPTMQVLERVARWWESKPDAEGWAPFQQYVRGLGAMEGGNPPQEKNDKDVDDKLDIGRRMAEEAARAAGAALLGPVLGRAGGAAAGGAALAEARARAKERWERKDRAWARGR